MAPDELARTFADQIEKMAEARWDAKYAKTLEEMLSTRALPDWARDLVQRISRENFVMGFTDGYQQAVTSR